MPDDALFHLCQSLVIGFVSSFAANIQHRAAGSVRDFIVLVPATLVAFLALVWS